ncbi:MAG: HIUase/Transthyretin family, partial [Marmoricola sp.]|nr:HIUase/Transthyretin family [Marmoricola sp.]
MTETTLSTHVLDAALGVPAVGLEVALATADGTPLETAT